MVLDWADGVRLDAWKELVEKRWLKEDAEFAAMAMRNADNRGDGGTHCGGNRSFERFMAKLVCIYMEQPSFISCHVSYLTITFLFVMQVAEAQPGEEITEMYAYDKFRLKNPDLSLPQLQLPVYFGHAQEDIRNYCNMVQEKYPEVEDARYVETDDESLLLSGHGLPHGRLRCLNTVAKPRLTTSFTRLKSTLTADSPPIPPRRQPRGSTSTSDVSFPHSHPFSNFCSCMAKC